MLYPHKSKLLPVAASLTLAVTITLSGPTQAAIAKHTLPTVEVSAQAQDDGRLDLDENAETGSHLDMSVRETPASVVVIDRAVIDARGAQTTHEALRAVPGMTMLPAPGNPGLRYRGFSGSSVTQLFNGINLHYSQAARPVDSWIYERVEAIGGPSSFLSGAGGVGGTVNYVTKLAEPGTYIEGRGRLGIYGLRELAFGVNFHIAGKTAADEDNHYLRIDSNVHNAPGWVGGERTQAKQLAASLRSDFSEGLRHTLAYEYQKEDINRPYWGTPLLNPVAGRARIDTATRFKNYNSNDGYYGQQVHWVRSLVQWDLVDDLLRLDNTLYWYEGKREYRNVEDVGYTPDNRLIIRSNAVQQLHDQHAYGDKLEARFSGGRMNWPVEAVLGADYSINKQSFHPDIQPGIVSIVDPSDFDPGYFSGSSGWPGTVRLYRVGRENEMTTEALYAEGRIGLGTDMQLVGAARHDQIRLNLTNWREVTPATPKSYQRSYNPTTGRLALMWAVTRNLNAYVQYATAADPPSGTLASASFADARNNRALSTGRQVEAGAKLDFWGGKGNATLAGYRIRRKNIASQDPDDRLKTVLVGQQSARGVELAVGLQASPKFAVQANVSLVEARYDDFYRNGVSLVGKTPRNIPALVANAWLSYAISPKFNVNAGLRHVDRVYADSANTVYWPSYTVLDLALALQINSGLFLSARVRNVTDEVYATDATPTMAYLGAPRTAEVTIQYRY